MPCQNFAICKGEGNTDKSRKNHLVVGNCPEEHEKKLREKCLQLEFDNKKLNNVLIDFERNSDNVRFDKETTDKLLRVKEETIDELILLLKKKDRDYLQNELFVNQVELENKSLSENLISARKDLAESNAKYKGLKGDYDYLKEEFNEAEKKSTHEALIHEKDKNKVIQIKKEYDELLKSSKKNLELAENEALENYNSCEAIKRAQILSTLENSQLREVLKNREIDYTESESDSDYDVSLVLNSTISANLDQQNKLLQRNKCDLRSELNLCTNIKPCMKSACTQTVNKLSFEKICSALRRPAMAFFFIFLYWFTQSYIFN